MNSWLWQIRCATYLSITSTKMDARESSDTTEMYHVEILWIPAPLSVTFDRWYDIKIMYPFCKTIGWWYVSFLFFCTQLPRHYACQYAWYFDIPGKCKGFLTWNLESIGCRGVDIWPLRVMVPLKLIIMEPCCLCHRRWCWLLYSPQLFTDWFIFIH